MSFISFMPFTLLLFVRHVHRGVQLIDEDHRLMRRNLEPAAATRAGREIVETVQMIAKLPVHRPVAFIGP